MTALQQAALSTTPSFAARLLAARLRADLTQEDLADVVGVSQQTIAKWEGELAVPRGEHRAAINRAVGVELIDESSVSNLHSAATLATDDGHQKVVIRELLMAELIIITMFGLMTTEQKATAQAQLAAIGIVGADMIRSSERRAAIVAGSAA